MRLRPYSNQITGHDCLLTTEDNSSICKIRNQNELQFYLDMDRTLQPFTPEFRDTVEVSVVEDEDGKYIFEADFDGRFEKEDFNQSEQVSSQSTRRKSDDKAPESNVKYNGLDPKKFSDPKSEFRKAFTNDRLKLDVPPILCGVGQNPWVERVYRFGRHTTYNEDTIPYIVLENLCRTFKKPCIIDMKLGTEMYAGDWPTKKVNNHIAKMKLTTTSTLGIRLSGLQIYQNGAFSCRDKFYGRGLSTDGLKDNIRLFFSSEKRVRLKILETVIDKVEKIKSVLSTLDGYRLFGSSLVVFYEAAESGNQSNIIAPRTDVRVVDFAHSRILKSSSPETVSRPDDGFIFGLTNFIRIMEDIKGNSQNVTE